MEEILRDLIAYPTVSGDKQATHDLLDYVAQFVEKRSMRVRRYEWNGFESLVAVPKTRGNRKRLTVMLAAHADVVPGNPEQFKLRKSAGRYYGRGVLDMKFALAAYLQLIDELQDEIDTYSFGLMVTSDEELGGANGVAKLVDEGYIPDVCILPDGGENWQIQTSSKGMWVFEMAALGRAAHGSRPWRGENAISKLLFALQEVVALFPEHQHPDTNTITVSRVAGGQALTQVPTDATMTVDIRTINSAEHARIHDAVLSICAKHNLLHTYIADAAPTSFDLADPLIAPFAKLVRQQTGVTPTGYQALGASDARYYVPFGVPCISVYPLGGEIHSEGEWLDCQALDQFKDITKQYLDDIARLRQPT